MRLLKHLMILLFAAILAGCAAGPVKLNPPEKDAVYKKFKTDQQNLLYWKMNAKFALRTNNRAHGGTIRWVNNGGNLYDIKLTGPMDQGAVVIHSDGYEVTLKDSQGFEGSAATPEAMLSRYTEYELPISNMKYWVKGLASPRSDAKVTLNPQGYPIFMEQDAWTVEYQYFREVGQFLLPRRIIITHPTLKITLSVYEWEVSDKPLNF